MDAIEMDQKTNKPWGKKQNKTKTKHLHSDGKLFSGQPVPEPRTRGRGACLGDAAFSLGDAAFGEDPGGQGMR